MPLSSHVTFYRCDFERLDKASVCLSSVGPLWGWRASHMTSGQDVRHMAFNCNPEAIIIINDSLQKNPCGIIHGAHVIIFTFLVVAVFFIVFVVFTSFSLPAGILDS